MRSFPNPYLHTHHRQCKHSGRRCGRQQPAGWTVEGLLPKKGIPQWRLHLGSFGLDSSGTMGPQCASPVKGLIPSVSLAESLSFFSHRVPWSCKATTRRRRAFSSRCRHFCLRPFVVALAASTHSLLHRPIFGHTLFKQSRICILYTNKPS